MLVGVGVGVAVAGTGVFVGVEVGTNVGSAVAGNGVGVGVGVGVSVGTLVGTCVGSDPHIAPSPPSLINGLSDVIEPSLAHTVLLSRLTTELLIVVPAQFT